MFGDEPILGYREVRLDEKSRIFLPKFTGVELLVKGVLLQ